MKKILFVVAEPGSARAFLFEHLKELVKHYEVHLAANFPNEESMALFARIGVLCHVVPIERSINIFKDIRALKSLYRLLKQERVDSTHSVTPKAGLLTSIASRMSGVKHRIHIFTGQVWATKHGAMRWLLKMMDRIVVHNDTDILVDGNSQRQFLIKERIVRRDNSRVLANGSICGVNIEKFKPSEETRSEERSAFGFNKDDVVYIFLGRLNHDKGIGELFEAFNRLVIDCPKAKLVLYGSDEEGWDNKLGDYIFLRRGRNYFYSGITSSPMTAMQKGDVFVLPTWREGFGSSVIEAQALGLPVITSDAYGVLDASELDVTGLRFKVGDSVELYRRMKRYYDNPELRKAHGHAGRKRVEELFDSRIVTKAWGDFYKDLLG